LQEALDMRTLLLERLKFTAIFSSNLDEFLMIRVYCNKYFEEQVFPILTLLEVDSGHSFLHISNTHIQP